MTGINGATANHAKKHTKKANQLMWKARIAGVENENSSMRVALFPVVLISLGSSTAVISRPRITLHSNLDALMHAFHVGWADRDRCRNRAEQADRVTPARHDLEIMPHQSGRAIPAVAHWKQCGRALNARVVGGFETLFGTV
jgi:hypothetical protein